MSIEADAVVVMRGFLPSEMAEALRNAAQHAYETVQATDWGGHILRCAHSILR